MLAKMAASGGCLYQFDKTRPHAELCARVTPARETQDSRDDGFDSIFTQKKVDLGPEKKTCFVYIYWRNTSGN
jgi:hypothetical protein